MGLLKGLYKCFSTAYIIKLFYWITQYIALERCSKFHFQKEELYCFIQGEPNKISQEY